MFELNEEELMSEIYRSNEDIAYYSSSNSSVSGDKGSSSSGSSSSDSNSSSGIDSSGVCPKGLSALALHCCKFEPTSRPSIQICIDFLEVILQEQGGEESINISLCDSLTNGNKKSGYFRCYSPDASLHGSPNRTMRSSRSPSISPSR